MNPIVAYLLSTAAKILIGSNLFAAIQDMVLAEMDSTKTGEEKKAAVKARLAKLKGDLGTAVKSVSGGLLNWAIETALVLIKSKL